MKLDRLVSILLLLLERKRIGARELAERFEVSPRTIYRDIEAINQAGVPVLSTPGAGGGFEILPQYKLDKKVFSASDLSAILMGLTNLSGLLRGDELAGALAKVESFIPAEKAKEIELRANQVFIDLSPWMGSRNAKPYLDIVQTAIRECRPLSFRYVDQRGSQTERIAEPYQLVLKNSQWYWQGYCRTRGDYRLFKLCRMSGLRMLPETFAPRSRPKPTLDFGDMPQAARTSVTLRFHRSILDRVLDYCAYEDLEPDGGERYIVRIPFVENDYNYDTLLGFGSRCECLGPADVRAEIGRRLREAAALYAE